MTGTSQHRVFPIQRWTQELPELCCRYQNNQPFPHIVLPDFVDPAAARNAAREFPAGDHTWTHYRHFNESKRGQAKRESFPASIAMIVDALMSPEFVAWLVQLTGIPELRADPAFDGGGMHQTERGGFLNIHADFSAHHYYTSWRRRCNLILYLNEEWLEEWGGSIELWDAQMQRCAVKIAPRLNHALIFNTTETSFHGYPEPLRCPEGVTRNSLALYYYTVNSHDGAAPSPTKYRSRPSDGLGKRLLISTDNRLLRTYSWLKRRFALSDDWASWVLGKLGRK